MHFEFHWKDMILLKVFLILKMCTFSANLFLGWASEEEATDALVLKVEMCNNVI